MSVGLKIWDGSGNLILDSNDRIVGALEQFNTNRVNGSHTSVPDTGQQVEFVYFLPPIWTPAGRASPWPTFGRTGNTLSWVYTAGVPEAQRVDVAVFVVSF